MKWLFEGKESRFAGVILVIVIICISAIVSEYQANVARKEKWEGRIVDTIQERKWMSWRRRLLFSALDPGANYNYYWKVECTDGKTRKVEVTPDLYEQGIPGVKVVKRLGIRYPDPPSEAELENAITSVLKEGLEKHRAGDSASADSSGAKPAEPPTPVQPSPTPAAIAAAQPTATQSVEEKLAQTNLALDATADMLNGKPTPPAAAALATVPAGPPNIATQSAGVPPPPDIFTHPVGGATAPLSSTPPLVVANVPAAASTPFVAPGLTPVIAQPPADVTPAPTPSPTPVDPNAPTPTPSPTPFFIENVPVDTLWPQLFTAVKDIESGNTRGVSELENIVSADDVAWFERNYIYVMDLVTPGTRYASPAEAKLAALRLLLRSFPHSSVINPAVKTKGALGVAVLTEKIASNGAPAVKYTTALVQEGGRWVIAHFFAARDFVWVPQLAMYKRQRRMALAPEEAMFLASGYTPFQQQVQAVYTNVGYGG